MSRRVRRALLALSALVALAVVLHGIWLPRVGLFLDLPDNLDKADAIVLWPGEYLVRLNKGVELYRAGWAPRILMFPDAEDEFFVTVARLLGRETTKTQALERYLERRGVPAEAIQVRGLTANESIPGTIGRGRFRRVIVVTGSYYMRRTIRQLRASLGPSGVRLYHVSTTPPYYDPPRWWRDRIEMKIVFGEYVRLLTERP